MERDTFSATVVSGIATNVLFHPLDTVRIIHQTASVHAPSQYWLWPPSRYWQGLVPAITFSVPAFVTEVCVYREAKHYWGESLPSYLAAGAVAQISSSVFWTPMDVVCGRLQLRATGKDRSMLNEIRSIYHSEGLAGFFRGYWLGIGIYLPYTMVWWAAYDELKGACGVLAASSLATVLGECLSNVFCLARARLQMATAPDLHGLRPSDAHGLRAVISNLLKEAGIARMLVRGLHIRLLTSVPMSAVSMGILEYLSPDSAGSDRDE